jgi:DNA-binding transcriptional ArsR family regulator
MARRRATALELPDRLALYFLLHPSARPLAREIEKHLDVGPRPLEAELDRLVEEGMVVRERQGRKVVFRPDEGHAGWDAVRRRMRELVSPADVLREALSAVPGIEAAVVYGPAAPRDAGDASEVEVLLVGDHVPRKELGRVTGEAAAVLGRELNVVQLGRAELREHLQRGEAFIRGDAGGPKEWVVGHARLVPELAAPLR